MKKSLEEIVSNPKSKSETSPLENMFSDKSKSLKAITNVMSINVWKPVMDALRADHYYSKTTVFGWTLNIGYNSYQLPIPEGL